MILDTNACIWFVDGNPRLGREALSSIRNALSDNTAAFSAISIWEIAMLRQKGRLDTNQVPDFTATQWRQSLLAHGFYEIPVDGAIAAHAGALDDLHGDPADRIIIATALTGHQLITADALILNWNGPIDAFPASR